eukprot:711371-Alexandrium_andersonii.AAC.1
MAPSRAGSSPAKPESTGGAGEWRLVQGRRAARRAQQPLKSVRTDDAAASGFARPGAQSQPYPTCNVDEYEVESTDACPLEGLGDPGGSEYPDAGPGSEEVEEG